MVWWSKRVVLLLYHLLRVDWIPLILLKLSLSHLKNDFWVGLTMSEFVSTFLWVIIIPGTLRWLRIALFTICLIIDLNASDVLFIAQFSLLLILLLFGLFIEAARTISWRTSVRLERHYIMNVLWRDIWWWTQDYAISADVLCHLKAVFATVGRNLIAFLKIYNPMHKLLETFMVFGLVL